MKRLLADESLTMDQLKQKLTVVVDEQDLLSPVVEDRLTTELTNAVLRRRDIILSTSQVQKFQEDSVAEFRASPLVGTDLFEFDSEVVKEEMQHQTSQSVVAGLRRPVQVVEKQSKPATATVTTQPVASTSAAYQAPAVQANTQPFPSAYAGYKPCKSRRGVGRGNSNRGSSSYSIFPSYSSGSRYSGQNRHGSSSGKGRHNRK